MTSYEAKFEAAKRRADKEEALLALLQENQEESEENSKTKENIINFLAEGYVAKSQPEKIKQILLEYCLSLTQEQGSLQSIQQATRSQDYEEPH
jgi:hypothetical protein